MPRSPVCMRSIRSPLALKLLLGLFALGACLLPVAAAALAPPAAGADPPGMYYVIDAIGPFAWWGSSSPDGACTDSAGNVYVTDPIGFSKFSGDGTLICHFTGIDEGYFISSCYGLDVDSAGRVYLAESSKNRVLCVLPDASGVNATSYHLGPWLGRSDGNSGTGSGEFNFPIDVAVDAGGYAYVADEKNNRIQKLRLNDGATALEFVAKWGRNGGDGTSGSGNGEFNWPASIACDRLGNLFVNDSSNQRVQKLTTSGAYVAQFSNRSPDLSASPVGIAVDSQGAVYLASLANPSSFVDKYVPEASSYVHALRFGSWGDALNQFKYAWDVAVAPSGLVYVTDTQNYRIKRWGQDFTAPTTSVSGVPAGWTNGSVTASLSAQDIRAANEAASGVSSVEYSLTGGASWNAFSAPLAFDAEGDAILSYRSVDVAGNVEATKTAHVLIDKTPPVTTVTGAPSGWSKKPVVVQLHATDALSGIQSTSYSKDGGATWRNATNVIVGGPGAITLRYRSMDVAGNSEADHSVVVRVDGTHPRTFALTRVTVRRGTKVTVRYRVNDATPKAKVRLVVKRGTRIVATKQLGWQKTNVGRSTPVRCTFPAGSYRYFVYATDQAGNAQRMPAGSKALTIQ